VLLRRGNKALGLTEPGRIVLERASRIIMEARELKTVGDELRSESDGKLVIATTQYHARYTLLPAIRRFRLLHPHVSFSILSVDPSSAARLVKTGDADFGLSGEPPEESRGLVTYPCFEVRRLVIVPRGHPLTKARRLSLQLLAKYPLIVYDRRLSGGAQVLRTFEQKGLKPEIALSAIDGEVLKAYVAAGLGIGIIQHLAYDPVTDTRIVALDPGNLFAPTTAYITLRAGALLRPLHATSCACWHRSCRSEPAP